METSCGTSSNSRIRATSVEAHHNGQQSFCCAAEASIQLLQCNLVSFTATRREEIVIGTVRQEIQLFDQCHRYCMSWTLNTPTLNWPNSCWSTHCGADQWTHYQFLHRRCHGYHSHLPQKWWRWQLQGGFHMTVSHCWFRLRELLIELASIYPGFCMFPSESVVSAFNSNFCPFDLCLHSILTSDWLNWIHSPEISGT